MMDDGTTGMLEKHFVALFGTPLYGLVIWPCIAIQKQLHWCMPQNIIIISACLWQCGSLLQVSHCRVHAMQRQWRRSGNANRRWTLSSASCTPGAMASDRQRAGLVSCCPPLGSGLKRHYCDDGPVDSEIYQIQASGAGGAAGCWDPFASHNPLACCLGPWLPSSRCSRHAACRRCSGT